MNAPLFPQILLRQDSSPQADLDLATEGVLRYVWSSEWGDCSSRRGMAWSTSTIGGSMRLPHRPVPHPLVAALPEPKVQS